MQLRMDISYLPGTWNQVPGTLYQVPGTLYQVPGTWYPALPIPGYSADWPRTNAE